MRLDLFRFPVAHRDLTLDNWQDVAKYKQAMAQTAQRCKKFERFTLLNLPLDMMSEMPLAASFFSATQRTRLICARFRIMSAGCVVSGLPTLCCAQEHLCWTPSRSIPDLKTDLLRKRWSIPSCTHQPLPLLQLVSTLGSVRSVSMIPDIVLWCSRHKSLK